MKKIVKTRIELILNDLKRHLYYIQFIFRYFYQFNMTYIYISIHYNCKTINVMKILINLLQKKIVKKSFWVP